MKDLHILKQQAQKYLDKSMSHLSTSDRVVQSREGKRLILEINEIFKINKDHRLMDLMKEITKKKKKVESRLKLRI